MNHHYRKILHSLYAHPIGGNISPAAVWSVMEKLGADVEERQHGKIAIRLNGHCANFPQSGHSLPVGEIINVRKFLENCGVDPGKDYPL